MRARPTLECKLKITLHLEVERTAVPNQRFEEGVHGLVAGDVDEVEGGDDTVYVHLHQINFREDLVLGFLRSVILAQAGKLVSPAKSKAHEEKWAASAIAVCNGGRNLR